MDAIEQAANVSVARACGFCALGIFCLMVGFSHEPHLAARVGGILCLAVTLVLLIKAAAAHRQPYRSTETWLMLAEAERPPPAVAQAVISAVLRRVFLQYARYAALSSILLLAAAQVHALVFG
jgi:hypothetical protein